MRKCKQIFVPIGIGFLVTTPVGGTPLTIYPAKDGTIADGGVYGVFDGVADDWDWTFNGFGGYEGVISLVNSDTSNDLEHRLVWEYDLSSVSLTPPVAATLTFTIRTAAAWPRQDFDVAVYAYPADLQETPDDFNAGPAVIQGTATVPAWAPPAQPQVVQHLIDVSGEVSQALAGGADMVAFRMQVLPGAQAENQAFIDADDANADTKPFLSIDVAPLPGDADGDGDVDLADYLVFQSCMNGPDVPVEPECDVVDLDGDGDVDQGDFAAFQSLFGPSV